VPETESVVFSATSSAVTVVKKVAVGSYISVANGVIVKLSSNISSQG
jgi:hypothetical protein